MNILLSVDRATEVASPTDDAILEWVNHTLTHILYYLSPLPNCPSGLLTTKNQHVLITLIAPNRGPRMCCLSLLRFRQKRVRGYSATLLSAHHW